MAGLMGVLGGALAGAGQGMSQDILARRQQAIEELRYQRDLQGRADDRSFQAGREDVRYGREKEMAETKQGWDVEADARDFEQAKEISGLDHRNALSLEGARNANEMTRAELKQRFDAEQAELDRKHEEENSRMEQLRAERLRNIDQREDEKRAAKAREDESRLRDKEADKEALREQAGKDADAAREQAIKEADRIAADKKPGEQFQTADGHLWVRGTGLDAKAKPVTDEKGNHLKGPSTVNTASTLSASKAWEMSVEAHSRKDPEGNKTTDWAAVAADMEDQGFGDQAMVANRSAKADVDRTDMDAATAQARKEAIARDKWGGEGFGDLSKEEWIRQRTDELYQGKEQPGKAEAAPTGLGGGGAAPAPAATATPPAQQPPPAETKPAEPPKPTEQPPTLGGSGTVKDPYRAASPDQPLTQAEVDWFKANAKKGDVIEVNGKKLVKQ